jgi:hypothetical protein
MLEGCGSESGVQFSGTCCCRGSWRFFTNYPTLAASLEELSRSLHLDNVSFRAQCFGYVVRSLSLANLSS